MTSIPVVDVSALLAAVKDDGPFSEDALRVCVELHDAFRTVGFAYISGHGVPVELQEDLQEVATTFFEKDESVKRAYNMRNGGRAWRGWFPVGDELTSGKPDFKEGFYFGTEMGDDHPRVVSRTPMHGANLFPDAQVPKMRPTVLTYMARCKDLAQALLKGLAVALLGGESERDYFAERFTAHPTELFRIFRYPERVYGPDEWAVGRHTDYGFLTILKQDDSGGLEVLTRGGTWLPAPPIRNTFVVNIGDMLEKWTRGVYRATPHRVRNLAPHDRYSFPYFFDPDFEATLAPIPKHMLKHEPLEKSERWDGVDVDAAEGTYKTYLLSKVLKVFPYLEENVK